MSTTIIRLTKAGFVVKINFFVGNAILGRFEHSSPFCPRLDSQFGFIKRPNLIDMFYL
jgi:hypothetical protein